MESLGLEYSTTHNPSFPVDFVLVVWCTSCSLSIVLQGLSYFVPSFHLIASSMKTFVFLHVLLSSLLISVTTWKRNGRSG